jgi:Protein of unknown function (DUF4239)
VNGEWPLMEEGRPPLMEETRVTPAGWIQIDLIRATVQEYSPRTEAEQELYGEALDQVQRLADARRMRLVEAGESSIPAVLWFVLIVGGIAAVGFTLLFGMENTWAHVLMVASLASVIALVLFTVAVLNYPFSGRDARIGTGAFDLVMNRFETSQLSDLR